MISLFRFLAAQRTFAYLLTATIVLLGSMSLLTIKRDNYPNVDLDEMSVFTSYPGASPADVELNVTNKLEEALKEVDSIDRMTSFSMENASFIHLRLDDQAPDMRIVKNRVRDAVSRVTDLPKGVTDAPVVTEFGTSQMPVIEVGITGNVPYANLREQAKQFESKLLRLDGVARVERYGYRAREIQVEISPGATKRYQVPVGQIVRAIQSRNIRGSAGSLQSYVGEQNIVTLAQFQEPHDVGEVIVRSSFEGSRLRVRDLATVKDGFERERISSRMNGQPAISFVVVKKETADIIRTVDEIKELVAREQTYLAQEFQLVFSADTSRVVRNRLDVVASNGLMGLGLVLLILLIFLNWRSAFWVAMGIPISLLGTIFLLPRFGAHLDSIAVAAMIVVIGIIVDDAIIIAENITRHREMGKTPLEAAAHGIREVFLPVLTTIITTILAFAPMFFMTGMLGKFVFVIPLIVVLSLVVSLVESVIALPAHLASGRAPHPERRQPKRSRFGRWLGRPFQRVAAGTIKLRYIVVPLFVGALAIAINHAIYEMDFVLFPGEAADEFHIQVELESGSSLAATSDKLKQIEEAVARLPKRELDSFTTRIGIKSPSSGTLAFSGARANYGVITVYLTPYGDGRREVDQIVEGLRVQTNAIDGVQHLTYYVEGGGPPVGRPVTLRVIGGDDSVRSALATHIVSLLDATGGVKDIDRDDRTTEEQLAIEINYDRLASLNLTVASVAQTLRLAYEGEVVTSVRYGDEDVDFRAILSKSARASMTTLGNIQIANPQGRLIPLREVATFESKVEPTRVVHFDNERTITLTADIAKGTATPLEVTHNVLAQLDIEKEWPGVQVVVGGEVQETQASMSSLLIAFAMAAAAIYVALALLFNSFIQPLMVMAIIPFGFIGVIAAFSFHGQPLGFVGMVGVVGLVGVLVNDSLILVKFINELRHARPSTDLKLILSIAVRTRLRPILITSVTTVCGLIPMAYGLGGSDPVMAPMALAMGYGIALATPLTLILLPCLLMIHNDVWGLARNMFVKSGLVVVDESNTRSGYQQPIVSLANTPRQAA